MRLGPFFDLVLARNTGISYGLLQTQAPLGQWAVARLQGGCRGCCSGSGSPARRPADGALSLGLIIGGAVGNAIDRLAYGWVADFVFFHISAAQLAVRLVCL